MPINESHPIMNIPTGNIPIWRYMDIPSFLSILTEETLTFVRADLFEDKFEGKLPKMTASLIDQQYRKEIMASRTDKLYWNISDILNNDNMETYINCWCNEYHEMVHMWKIYSKEYGVAIQTDYEKLKDSIISTEDIYPTMIKYVDFDNDVINWKSNSLTVYTLKRKEYKSENEFRLILSYPRELEESIPDIKDQNKRRSYRKNLYGNTPVIKCKVNPIKLIQKIHLSPYAPNWYLNLITDLAEKYELDVDSISQSEL